MNTSRVAAFALLLGLLSLNSTSKVLAQDSQAIIENYEPSLLDTTMAVAYVAKGKQLFKAAKYDSSNFYYERAKVIYEELAGKHNMQVLWERTVQSYNGIGTNLRRLGKYELAIEQVALGLQLGLDKLGTDHVEVAQCYHNIAIIHRRKGEYDLALKNYQKALSIRLRTLGEEHSDVARSYNGIGLVYWNQGDYEKAKEFNQRALSIQLRLFGENHPDVATSYNSLGLVCWNAGDYDLALRMYQKSLAIRLELFGEIHRDVAGSYNNIGLIYKAKGDFARALEVYQKALAQHLELYGETHYQTAGTHNNIATVYRKQGDYDQALVHAQKALSVFIRSLGETHPKVGFALDNIAIVHAEKDDHDKALVYFKKGLAIRQRVFGEAHPQIADSYDNIGVVYFNMNEYEEALAYFKKSLEIRLELLGEEHPQVASSYNNIGSVASRKGEYGRAIEYYKKALTIGQKVYGTRHPDIGDTNRGLATVYEQMSDYHKALSFCQRALISLVSSFEQLSTYANPPLEDISSEISLLNTLKIKARILTAQAATTGIKDMEMALRTYELAIQLIDKMRKGYKAEGSKLTLTEKAAEVYEKAIASATQLYEMTQDSVYQMAAFRFAENSKASVLSESLQESHAKAFSGIPDRMLAHEKQLRIDLTYYDTQIQKERQKREDRDSLKISKFSDRFFALNREYRKLIETFEKKYPYYYDLKYRTRTASIAEIQATLDKKTALLEYFFSDERLYIFLISKQAFYTHSFAIDSTFSETVDLFHNSVRQAKRHNYIQSARKLYTLLVEPIADKVASKKNLVIVPHGILYRIPFEALLAEDPDKGLLGFLKEEKNYSQFAYLVKRHNISYHYSATLLTKDSNARTAKPEQQADFVGFAPVFPDVEDITKTSLIPEPMLRSIALDGRKYGELKHSETEVVQIAALFRDWSKRAEPLLYADATEQDLKSKAGSASNVIR